MRSPFKKAFRPSFAKGPFPPSAIVNLAEPVESGFWALTTGNPTANADRRRLPDISVSGSRDVFIQHAGDRSDVIWMDGTATFIQRDNPTGISTGATVTPPVNARSVRINVSFDGATYDALNDEPIVREL